MEAEENYWHVIINPTSGGGLSKRKWPAIANALKDNGFLFKHQFTSHRKHSVDLVKVAVNQGVKKFIVVGGDGTIHNVVNGIMQQKQIVSRSIVFGVIPIGTGNDWVKTYDIPKNINKAVNIIKKGHIVQQDVGEMILESEPTQKIYFNNLAGVGYDGYVVHRVEKIKYLGALAYLYGAVSGLLNAKNIGIKLGFNSSHLECNALMVLVGLCKYSGGGMQLTSSVDPTDGLFDVSVAKNFSGLDLLRNLPKLFNGAVTRNSKIITEKTNDISVAIKTNNAAYVQADGELIGVGGFSAKVIPKAISFFVN